MIQKLIRLMLLILVMFTSCNKNNREPIVINAEKLILEFKNDAMFASQKYKGTLLQVTGEVVYKASPKDYIPLRDASYVVFGRVNQRGSHIFSGNTIILCYFDNIVVHELNEGDVITVQGNFKSYGNTYGNIDRITLNKGKILQ